MDLTATSALLRLLSDPTRVRLLALLEREELTVAELSAILRLAQPRVSTHLAKLSGIPTEGAAVKVFDPSEHCRPESEKCW